MVTSAKNDIRSLVERMIGGEEGLRKRSILAPAVRGGRIAARVGGLVHAFRLDGPAFEGWGIFRPVDSLRVRLEGAAPPALVEAYLAALEPCRLVLVRRLEGRSWLGRLAGADDRPGRGRPAPVHLVDGAERFDIARGRRDGRSIWFEAVDRGADPRIAAGLRRSLSEGIDAGSLRVRDLTPQLREAYALAAGEVREARRRGEENRIRDVLERFGGRLEDVREAEGGRIVTWRGADGWLRHTLVRGEDLTVVSAGICLDGRDEEFDLASLTSVFEEYERNERDER